MNTSDQSNESSLLFDKWIVKISKFYETFQTLISQLLLFIMQALVNVLKTTINEFGEVSKKLTVIDYAFFMSSLCAFGCSFLVFFSGLGVLGYQSALWLQEGKWTELPLLTIFNYLFEGAAIQSWINNPQSWFGLHQVVDWCLQNIPLSLTLILHGIFLVTITGCFLFFSIVCRYLWLKKIS